MRKSTELFAGFIKAADTMELTVNEQKSKLIASTSGRVCNIGQHYAIDNFIFEVVANFIYLGSLVTARKFVRRGKEKKTFGKPMHY